MLTRRDDENIALMILARMDWWAGVEEADQLRWSAIALTEAVLERGDTFELKFLFPLCSPKHSLVTMNY
jgi:hypothetical protein